MPGYVDLQVNGYFGVDYNCDDLTADQLNRSCRGLRDDGVDKILATIITEHVDVMAARLTRLVELREQDPLAEDVIAGFHIEGPFINERQGYRGAHPEDAITPADPDAMKRLLDAAGGLTRIVTLAPERDIGLMTTRFLAGQNVKVSAGHCDPTHDELLAAIDAGLSMYTHLGNGCPMLMDRHDNIIQRVLSRAPDLMIGFIADGVHVPYFALQNYIRTAGVEHCVVVTDAMSAAGLGAGRYKIGRWDLLVGDDLAVRAPDGSHLVGSALSMKQAHHNLLHNTDLNEAEVKALVVTHPRAIIAG
jgi:N-acetylglucosamine-6-phosphate deacetylase